MSHTAPAPRGAALEAMSAEKSARGAAIASRRGSLELSQREMAKRTGMSRVTIANAEKGGATEATYRQLEAELAAAEAQAQGGAAQPAPAGHNDLEPGVVRFKIRGPHTAWEMETEAHVEDIDAVTEAVERLMRHVDPPTD